MPQYKYPVSKGFKWLTKFNYVDPIDGKTKSKLKVLIVKEVLKSLKRIL